MLVSVFVTPPGLHARGSPFFAFSYTTIALITLITSLLFFAVPSQPARVVSFVTAALLLVDVVMMLAVEKTRHEELWVGVVSVTWATLMAVWAVAADRTVQVRFFFSSSLALFLSLENIMKRKPLVDRMY